MPSNLSPAAKSKIAAFIAVLTAGVTAWQAVTRDGFTWLDIIPVAGVVAGAIATDLIPNTPAQPVAKAIAHGALSAVSFAAAAIAAFVTSHPSELTGMKLLLIGGGAFLVWYVPELAPAVRVVEGEVAAGAPAGAVLAAAAADVSASMGPDLPAAPVVPAPRDLSETQPFTPVTGEPQPAAQKGA